MVVHAPYIQQWVTLGITHCSSNLYHSRENDVSVITKSLLYINHVRPDL